MRLKNLETLRGSSFVRAKLSSKAYFSSTLTLLVSSASDACRSLTRVGFIVTKKNGGSVKRNFLRRRMRAAASKIISQFADKNKTYILIAISSLLEENFGILERDLRYCLKNSGSLQDV